MNAVRFTPNRASAADALRGLAALAVCLYHLASNPGNRLVNPLTFEFFRWGWSGVEVFFVLSGFVMPWSMAGRYRGLADAPLFLWRRCLRIVPPAWVALVLFIGVYAMAWRLGLTDNDLAWQLTPTLWLANFTFTVPWGDTHWLNGVYWTLAIEFQYYIALALVFAVWFRSGRTVVAGALLAALLPHLIAPTARSASTLVPYLPLFALGGLLAALRLGRLSHGTLMASACVMLGSSWWVLGPIATSAAALTLCAMLVLDLSARPWAWLGRISYSLYLVHMLLTAVGEVLVQHLAHPTSDLGKALGQGLCLLLVLAGAWVFWWAVERPSIAWSRQWRIRRSLKAV